MKKNWTQLVALFLSVCMVLPLSPVAIAMEMDADTRNEQIEYHEKTPGMAQRYLDFSGRGWDGDYTQAALWLFRYDGETDQLSDSSNAPELAILDKDGINSGVYMIVDPAPRDHSAIRAMHAGNGITNQCRAEGVGTTENVTVGHGSAHLFRFRYYAEKRAYTIQNIGTGKYLTQTASGTQLAMTGEPAYFYITPVDRENNDGSYYIWWETEVRQGEAISDMFTTAPDNTWVFTGGRNVECGFSQTQGKRNFVGHFEEYVRWQNNGGENGRQRYTINTAREGLTLKEIVSAEGWQALVADFNPRAVAYMVEAGDLEADLKSFIDQALALRSNNGFAVIQTLNGVGAATAAAAVAKYAGDSNKCRRIVVIDHILTDIELTNGQPNAAGHYKLGEQFAQHTYGSTVNYPCGQGVATFTEAERPAVYDTQKVPTVAFTPDGTMTVSLNGVSQFTYKLRLESGVTVSGTAVSGTATITGLTEGQSYTLIVRSVNGSTQYKTTYGTVGTGTSAPVLTQQQQEIAALMEREEPVTWLFMGDSITHGALWTKGYDSVSQTFDKYLDLLGRPRDVVINTAVSGATTTSTYRSIQYRLNQYVPDVVSIMLGTNDSSNNQIAQSVYRANLQTIIDAVRAKNGDAVIILRSPSGHWTRNHPNIEEYCNVMKDVAETNGCIYIDQYTGMQAAVRDYPWSASSGPAGQILYGDTLHPGALGQLAMAKMFIKAIGLWNEDNPITNLDYVATTPETSATVPEVTWTTEGNTTTLRLAPIPGYGQTTMSATKDGQTWSVTVEVGETAELSAPNGLYSVSVTAVSTSAAKTVTFGEQTINTGKEPAVPVDILAKLEQAGYHKVSSTNDLVDNQQYLILTKASDGKVYALYSNDGNADTFSGDYSPHNRAVEISVDSGGAIVLDYLNSEENPESLEALHFTANQNDGKYSFKSGQHYLSMNVGNPPTTFSTTSKNLVVSADENGAFTIKTDNGSGGRKLAFNKAGDSGTFAPNGNTDFWCPMTTALTTPIYLYANVGVTAPEELTAYEYQKVSGALEEGTYAIAATTTNSARHRVIHPHVSGDALKIDQCQIHEGDVPGGEKLTVDHDEHRLKVAVAEGGYTFQVQYGTAAGKYLNGGVGTLSLSDTPTAFTAVQVEGGYQLTWNSNGTTYYICWGNSWKASTGAYTVSLYRETEVEPTMAQTHFSGVSVGNPLVHTDTNSYFRIPSLITLKNGWIIASSDIRWRGTGDNPNNIDTIVSISKDDGEVWNWEVVNYFADHASTSSGKSSAAFIDPAFVEGGDGKVWMIVDATPAYGGNMGGNRMIPTSNPAISGFDSQGRVLVGHIPDITEATYHPERGDYSYDYYVDLNNPNAGEVKEVEGKMLTLYPIRAQANDWTTGYYADAFANTYYDYGREGVKPVLARQIGSSNFIHNNLFYLQSEWKVPCTFYLMIRSATVTDSGLEWSDPTFINVKKPGERFTGVGPGRGTIATVNGRERIIFPLYDNGTGNELASVVYSDDNGQTWQRGERTTQLNDTGKSSESQIVILPDGNLRMYSRNTKNYISYTDSRDGGVSWGPYQMDPALQSQNPGNGCMVSFINLEGRLISPEGRVYENLIMGSYSRHQRYYGVVRIGSIDAETNEVTWLNNDDYLIGTYTPDKSDSDFSYSCLAQLRNPDGSYRNEVCDLVEYNVGRYQIPCISIDFERLLPGWTFVVQDDETVTLPEEYMSQITLCDSRDYPRFTDDLVEGVYVIRDPAPGIGGSRVMHSAEGSVTTDQCRCDENSDGGISLLSCFTAHLWRFARQDDGTWTIESVANPGKYLTNTASGSQLALQDTPTAFTITRNGGSYQIDADGKSLWCNGNGWIMNNGGKSLNLYQERILSYTYNVSNVGLGNLIAAAEAVGIEVPEFCTQAMHIQTAYTGVDRDAVKAQAMAAQAQINEASKTLYTLLGDVDISQKPNEITPGDVIQAILGFLFPAWFANS